MTTQTQTPTKFNKFTQIHEPEPSKYIAQANKFLADTGTTLEINFKRHGKHWDSDTQTRDIYECTLIRGSRKFTFDFGNSVINSGIVHAWSIDGAPTFRHNNVNCMASYYLKDAHKILYHSNKFEILEKRTKPSSYDILACLTTYDPDTFENFCSNFGYDTDSKKAEKTYNSVLDEWKNIQALFTDEEIGQLAEIQ